MAYESGAEFLVLHVLRLKGFVEADVVAALAGLDLDAVTRTLGDLQGRELVSRREGRLSGWSLTPAGRAEHASLVTREVDEAACRHAIDASYRTFSKINADLLQCCTDWQMRTVGGEQQLNDHSDADYDRATIASLRRVDDAAQPVCADLAGQLARLGGYGPRLAAAVRRVEAGELEWFTKPMIDSYHTVWFELHEDLLATLGLDRATEEA